MKERKEIAVYEKSTSAMTQYYTLSLEDEIYIYDWLQLFAADMCEVITRDSDMQRELLRRRPNVFPKGKSGPNSVLSFAGGMIANKKRNSKQNLSEPQLDSIEYMFEIIARHYYDEDDCLPIKFIRSI